MMLLSPIWLSVLPKSLRPCGIGVPICNHHHCSLADALFKVSSRIGATSWVEICITASMAEIISDVPFTEWDLFCCKRNTHTGIQR